MAYVDTPIATDGKNKSQGEIQQNFIELNTIISVDHEAFTAAPGSAGKHKQVTFTKQADDPATLSDQMAIYNKGNALFIQPEDKAAGTDGIDFTSYTHVASKGHTILPSGLILNWGKITFAGTNGGENFSKAYQHAPLSVTFSVNTIVGGGVWTDFKFAVTSSDTMVAAVRSTSTKTVTFSYLAIGI